MWINTIIVFTAFVRFSFFVFCSSKIILYPLVIMSKMKPNRKEIRTEASNPTESLRPESYSFTWIHIPWLSKLRCTEVVIKLFCLNGKLLDQCNTQYPEEISHNCYLHAILCTRNTLYIICSCSMVL